MIFLVLFTLENEYFKVLFRKKESLFVVGKYYELKGISFNI